MKQFIKQNLLLLSGAFLTIFLVISFWLAAVLPDKLVSPPQYDFIFTSSDYPVYRFGSNFIYYIKQDKLWAKYICNNKCDINDSKIKLYFYHVKKRIITEIPVDISSIPKNLKSYDIEFPVSSMKNYSFSPEFRAPDGYRIFDRNRSFSSRFIDNYLSYPYNAKSLILEKNGKSISLFPAQSGYFDFRFVGWVVKEEGQ